MTPRHPATRHARGVLAFAQLDHVARIWAEGRSQREIDGMLEVLADSWTHLLGGGAPAAD